MDSGEQYPFDSMKDITLPRSVLSLDMYAFAFDGFRIDITEVLDS
jgi:hypothetical protein